MCALSLNVFFAPLGVYTNTHNAVPALCPVFYLPALASPINTLREILSTAVRCFARRAYCVVRGWPTGSFRSVVSGQWRMSSLYCRGSAVGASRRLDRGLLLLVIRPHKAKQDFLQIPKMACSQFAQLWTRSFAIWGREGSVNGHTDIGILSYDQL